MTKLEIEIKKAVSEQYSSPLIKSQAENELAWQIQNCTSLPQPTRQVKLILNRKFMFDFVWVEQSIVVEVDGGIWLRGRGGHGAGAHSRPRNILRDMEKSNLAQKNGYRFFRFTPEQVKNGEALEFIRQLF